MSMKGRLFFIRSWCPLRSVAPGEVLRRNIGTSIVSRWKASAVRWTVTLKKPVLHLILLSNTPENPVSDRRKSCRLGGKSELRSRSAAMWPRKWSLSTLKVVTLTLKSDDFWGQTGFENLTVSFDTLNDRSWKGRKVRQKCGNSRVLVGSEEGRNRKTTAFCAPRTPISIIFPEFSGGKPDRFFSRKFRCFYDMLQYILLIPARTDGAARTIKLAWMVESWQRKAKPKRRYLYQGL